MLQKRREQPSPTRRRDNQTVPKPEFVLSRREVVANFINKAVGAVNKPYGRHEHASLSQGTKDQTVAKTGANPRLGVSVTDRAMVVDDRWFVGIIACDCESVSGGWGNDTFLENHGVRSPT